MTEKDKKIKSFKESQDYIDICYMIDHVSNPSIRNSCLEDLGYSIGLNLVTKDNKTESKDVIIGAKGEFRVQSATAENDFVDCVICKTVKE